jgi:hypothetical protein
MRMSAFKNILFATFLMGGLATQLQANVIVTYAEDSGSVSTSLKGTSGYDFNSLPLGTNTNVTWNGVGTFDQLYIKSADVYGGANGSSYSVQGVGSSVSQTILNLNSPSAYLGFWWSAGDSANVVKFYSGLNGTGTLIAEFTTDSLLKVLASQSSYYGNPNTGYSYSNGDSGEPFAYLNFFAMDGTDWSSIVFTNNSGSGFESDNYASRVEAYNAATDGPMPGVAFESIDGTSVVALAPEPSTYLAMIGFCGLSVVGAFARGLKKRNA